METPTNKKFIISLIATALMMLSASAIPPEITSLDVSPETLVLEISNVTTGGTYYVERTEDLTTNNWVEVGASFEGLIGSTNWSESLSSTSMSAFYRVVRDPYHPKVGESASLDVPGFHNVSGTAHIINNRTIELRNFNFDGGGLDVRIYISPNASFSLFIAISDNLLGQVFEDDTLTLNIPEGTDLDSVSYISVWCVAASVSFGDGQFQ